MVREDMRDKLMPLILGALAWFHAKAMFRRSKRTPPPLLNHLGVISLRQKKFVVSAKFSCPFEKKKYTFFSDD
jgi:hypothetical protein